MIKPILTAATLFVFFGVAALGAKLAVASYIASLNLPF